MRKDPHTGELFEPKRNNQVFANRNNQVAFNNLKARKNRNKTILLDKRLKKNRTIISNILGANQTVEISKQFLSGNGFDFSVFNRIIKKNEVEVYGIYEFYLQPISNNNFKLGKLDQDGTGN
jgi:hypothetical protein